MHNQEDRNDWKLSKLRDEFRRANYIQSLWFTAVVVILFTPVFYLTYKSTRLNITELNAVPAKIKFERLAMETLKIVDKYYYPNLQFVERFVPPKISDVINQNIDELNEMVIKKEVNPEDTPEYFFTLGLIACGRLATNINNVEYAIENFERYLQLKPYDERVITNLALCYAYGTKDYKKALMLYDEALEYNPEYCRAHYNKALVLWRLERQEEAMIEIDNLIKNSPNCAESFFVMSLIQYQLENRAGTQAIFYLERALEKGFNDISWLTTTSFYDEDFRRSKAYKNAVKRIAESRFLPNISELYKELN